jgi:hypothetical protein
MVPAFTTNPTGKEASITYSDVGMPASVTFDPATRTYSWSSLLTPQTFTLTMQGQLGTAPVATVSFTVTIADSLFSSFVIQPSIITNQHYTLFSGQSNSFIVPAFFTNPTG